MKGKLIAGIILFFLFHVLSCVSVFGQGDPHVEVFSPQGGVKSVRQVTVRFSEEMTPFGNPRLVEPFEINCSEKGHARWADGKNWIYDFDRDIPAGVACEFTVKAGLKTLTGGPIGGQQKFSFSTGGPAIKESYPHEGSEDIEEEQVFVLLLDAAASEDSVVSNVSCVIEGIQERVGVRILMGEEQEKIMKIGGLRRYKDMPRVVLECRRSFPNNARVSLVWGKGVGSVSGVQTTENQTLSFKTRGSFTAAFSCERENAKANCIPILPVELRFSSPVSWDSAKKIVLKTHDRVFKPVKTLRGDYSDEEEGGEVSAPDENFVFGVSFAGPFPENASFEIDLPKDITDDAGRNLENKDKFPLMFKTDSYPPLAKFSARFGIIELTKDAALPVTIRNLEPAIVTRMLSTDWKKHGAIDRKKEELLERAVKLEGSVGPLLPDAIKEKGKEHIEGLKGRLHEVRMDKEEKVIEWLKRVASAKRETSLLTPEADKKEFPIPKPGGSRAFEVVGIPLKEPGFYVVEIESRLLGESLLGDQKPMYVPTAALVTNLSAHFKWGRESSLVWVTTLDKAEPVKDASVLIRDCNGKMVWQGKTDENGLAKINTPLPKEESLPRCSVGINYGETTHALQGIGSGLFIFAKTSKDMTFVHSSWDNGIEPWRYNLPDASYRGPVIAHTIFDRTLVRAGETVHMKHIVRKHTMLGFSVVDRKELPKVALIRHQGSEQRYEFPLTWDSKGIAETSWKIPADSKLGYYEVTLLKQATEKPASGTAAGGADGGDEEYVTGDGYPSGSFRVEEFRIPLMKGVIQSPKEPLVNAREANVDLLVTYLSGGGASNAQVKLRSQVQPKFISFDDYEDFTFANGEIKEGITRRSDYEETEERQDRKSKTLTSEVVLDKNGGLRTKISDLPSVTVPNDILAELEFKDPNGEIQTVTQKIALWPSKLLVGIKPDSWASSKELFKFKVAVLNLEGKPVPDAAVKVELLQRKFYSHRKRLVGGFYSYEHVSEIKRVAGLCEGRSDQKGLLACETQSPVSGDVVIQAQTVDKAGNVSTANRDVWIAGKGEWWFDVSDNDRIDLLPEKKRYEPGETAKFQVRMPFRNATALITVEREGVMETIINKLSGKAPVIELPVKSRYAPNVFVSVLVVRGRVKDVQPTAMVDLGKPAYKLGIAEINVGWKGHELKVGVSPEKSSYRIREKALVKIHVRRANGALPPKGSEVAIAVVDEGLLELMPNSSWKLLEAMMERRGYEVRTSTAQMQVVGKRHYGLKSLPQGGGGGRQVTRELFDTLLLWKARVPLDKKGETTVTIPLNDSLTSFRIVAVASGGVGLFGTGQTSIRTTQDLMVLSGIPPVVREGDYFRAGFTIRNTSNRRMAVEVTAKGNNAVMKNLEPIGESLLPGESKEIGWEIKVPYGIEALSYEVTVAEKDGDARDTVKVKQKVSEAVPVRTFQAIITQVANSFSMDVEKPGDALPARGGINLAFSSKLSDGLGGVVWYMKRYPYTCMEQKVSKAVALRDDALWMTVIAELPSHLDADGLVKYFPTCDLGSDTLTSYILSIASEAGRDIPGHIRERMEAGLIGFIEGKVVRYSSLPTADLSMRKVAAAEALSRSGKAEPRFLDSLTIEPNLWPTSAVLDWTNVLLRVKDIPNREKRLKEAEQILRARLNFQGTTMGFSTDGMDNLWWLMVSADVNAVKGILTLLNFDDWNQDMPKLVRGALGRQYRGTWNLTTANAWGVLAVEKFSKKFEAVPVTGKSSAVMAEETKSIVWDASHEGKGMMFGWPKTKEKLTVTHEGTGKPWAVIQSLAAIPLKEPFSSGYRIKKTLIPVEQKSEGKWSRGDVVRVNLEVEAQADMTWVVVSDPVPAGSIILGTGLGKDSRILTRGEENKGWVWPAFEERSFEAFRAYYEFVPKGKWTVEYTIRLNNSGTFHLPTTRVEALYAPEMLGEIPNKNIEVEQ
jgi:alpha-2-macroglobulin